MNSGKRRLTVEADTRDILPTAVLWLVLVLAVVNEIITQNPGMPPARPHISDALIAVLIGLVVVGAGRFVNFRIRALRPSPASNHATLAFYSVVIGVVLGAVIVGQVVTLAQFDSGLSSSYARFVSEPLWAPLLRAFSAGVIEEVIFRYIGMAAIVLMVAGRFAKPQHAYRIALTTTAVIFGALHLPGVSIVGLVIVLFNAAAGFLLGWMYWHWGVAHAILCHFSAGVIIQSVAPRILA